MGGIGGFRLFMHLLQRMLVDSTDMRARADANGARMFARFVGKAVSATLFAVPLYVAAENPHDQATLWTWLAASSAAFLLATLAWAALTVPCLMRPTGDLRAP